MAAYVICDIEVTDREGYDDYKDLAAPAVAQYGGKYLVRGGRHETLEGHWQPNRVVLLEFESVEQARQWWTSPEYEAAKEVRRKNATSNIIVVEGA